MTDQQVDVRVLDFFGHSNTFAHNILRLLKVHAYAYHRADTIQFTQVLHVNVN